MITLRVTRWQYYLAIVLMVLGLTRVIEVCLTCF